MGIVSRMKHRLVTCIEILLVLARFSKVNDSDFKMLCVILACNCDLVFTDGAALQASVHSQLIGGALIQRGLICSLRSSASDLLLDEGERVLDGDLRGSLVDLEAELLLAVGAVLVLLSQCLIILVLNELHAGSRLITLQLTLVVVVIVVVVEVDILLGSHAGELTLQVLEGGVHLGDLGSLRRVVLITVHVGSGDHTGGAVGLRGTVLGSLPDDIGLVGRRHHLLLLGGRAEDVGHELISDLRVIKLRQVVHLILGLDTGHGQRSGLVVDRRSHRFLHGSGTLTLLDGERRTDRSEGEVTDAVNSGRIGILRLEHNGAALSGLTDECRNLTTARQQHLLRESRLHVTGTRASAGLLP